VTSIDPAMQPRIDMVVSDPATGKPRRRVEYSGTVWLGGRPQVTGRMIINSGQWIKDLPPFFLPDSLPYKRDAVADGAVAVTVAIQSAPDHVTVHDARAAFGDDPGVPGRCWVQLAIAASGRGPLGISYRAVAITSPDAVDGA
jgi:hypothetical protein